MTKKNLKRNVVRVKYDAPKGKLTLYLSGKPVVTVDDIKQASFTIKK
jgi:hypothetical protein